MFNIFGIQLSIKFIKIGPKTGSDNEKIKSWDFVIKAPDLSITQTSSDDMLTI